MAFNTFLQLGVADKMRPEDFLDDDEDFSFDQDPDYGIPPQDRAPKPQVDQAQLELQRIQNENRAREQQLQSERLENARRLGSLEAQIQALKESRQSNIQDPQQANEYVENFWSTQGQQKPQGQQKAQQPQQQPTTPAPQSVEQVVDNRLRTLAQSRAEAQAEEDRLAQKFKNDFPHLIKAGVGPEAYHEWEKLKALRGDLPGEQRYQLMVAEMQRRYQNVPKNFSVPVSENPTVPSREMEDMFSNDPRSERKRQVQKAKDTARRVKHFRDDQLHRTSIAMG